ncbi:MAG: TOBE domain-containing protein [Acidimicrobiales bacterium]
MIRPASVRLCSRDDEQCHLAGPVADVAFRGRGYEHAVELDAPGTAASLDALALSKVMGPP